MTAQSAGTLTGPRFTLPRVLRTRAAGRFFKGALGLLIAFAVWWISVPLVGLPTYFYPSPSEVWAAFVELVYKGLMLVYVGDSLYRYGLGVAWGTLAGVSVGLAVGLNRWLFRLLWPAINFFYSLVEVAWVPLLVLWFGLSLTTIVVTVALVVIWPVLFSTVSGIRTLPPVYVNASRSLGASRLAILRDVIIPGALPSILTGFRISAGFGFRALVLGELIAAKSGIGFLIFDSAASLQTARTIVGMITMGLLWIFIDNMYLKPFEAATVRRWGVLVTAEDHG